MHLKPVRFAVTNKVQTFKVW